MTKHRFQTFVNVRPRKYKLKQEKKAAVYQIVQTFYIYHWKDITLYPIFTSDIVSDLPFSK